MVEQITRSPSWASLVASLASWVGQVTDPFQRVTVVVPSPGVGRALSQQLAAALPTGICAGVAMPSLAAWRHSLAEQAGLADELAPWQSYSLELTLAQVLSEMSAEPQFPLLAQYLGSSPSATRRHKLAHRVAGLLRRYQELAPELLAGWLEGHDVDGAGDALPAHLAWQPEALRRACDVLDVNPPDSLDAIVQAATELPAPQHLGFFALGECSAAAAQLVSACARAWRAPIWEVLSPATTPLLPDHPSPAIGTPHVPHIGLHGASSRLRQAEVLRDELCRHLAAHPDVEPRDVLVICPRPESWAPVLHTVFQPVPEAAQAHPGRSLRLRISAEQPVNQITELILTALALDTGRAGARDLLDLFMSPPVARRWGFEGRVEQLARLVSSAGIRWGLDTAHRAQHQLPGLPQNTWLRGIDRLLLGIALPAVAHDFPLTGVDGVDSASLPLVGSLAELLSRLRRFNGVAEQPADVKTWAGRVRQLADDLLETTFDDDWMRLQLVEALAGLTEAVGHPPGMLGRAEFRMLLEAVTRTLPERPAVANGALHVVAPGELQHVAHKLVCFLGLEGATGPETDAVALGAPVRGRRRQLLDRLASHARCAPEVLVVHQSTDPRTGEPVPRSTTITQLLHELDAGPESVEHCLHAHDGLNFGERPSFDVAAFRAARILSQPPARPRAHETRRRQALTRRVSTVPATVTVAQLARFLKDPAEHFLTHAAGGRSFVAARVSEAIPLVLDGLDRWGLLERVLHGFMRGLDREQVRREESRRELLPPGRIGAALFAEALDSVAALFSAAWAAWDNAIEDIDVELPLGHGVTLFDSIRVRGSGVVGVSVATSSHSLLEPWLQTLALSAVGREGPGLVFHHTKDFSRTILTTTTLRTPPADEARGVLEWVAAGYSLGRQRLIPLPHAPALARAQKWRGHRIDPWALQLDRFSDTWPLFAQQIDELLDVPVTEQDPGNAHQDAFSAWAEAIYVPFLTQRVVEL